MALQKTLAARGEPTTAYHRINSFFGNPRQRGLSVEVASYESQADREENGDKPVAMRTVDFSGELYEGFDIAQPVLPQLYAMLKAKDEKLKDATDI